MLPNSGLVANFPIATEETTEGGPSQRKAKRRRGKRMGQRRFPNMRIRRSSPSGQIVKLLRLAKRKSEVLLATVGYWMRMVMLFTCEIVIRINF
jgi:hypothetical protein